MNLLVVGGDGRLDAVDLHGRFLELQQGWQQQRKQEDACSYKRDESCFVKTWQKKRLPQTLLNATPTHSGPLLEEDSPIRRRKTSSILVDNRTTIAGTATRVLLRTHGTRTVPGRIKRNLSLRYLRG